jgi:hypothetical protein
MNAKTAKVLLHYLKPLGELGVLRERGVLDRTAGTAETTKHTKGTKWGKVGDVLVDEVYFAR